MFIFSRFNAVQRPNDVWIATNQRHHFFSLHVLHTQTHCGCFIVFVQITKNWPKSKWNISKSSNCFDKYHFLSIQIMRKNPIFMCKCCLQLLSLLILVSFLLRAKWSASIWPKITGAFLIRLKFDEITLRTEYLNATSWWVN